MANGSAFFFTERSLIPPRSLQQLVSIALVLLVLTGFFNLPGCLEVSLYQKCRNIMCFLPISKLASCYSSAVLADVTPTAFPDKLKGEFAKCGQLAEGVSQRFTQADHRHTNPTDCHLLEFCFLGHPAQPLLSVTAILGCIFPHFAECLDASNFVICIVLQPNMLL